MYLLRDRKIRLGQRTKKSRKKVLTVKLKIEIEHSYLSPLSFCFVVNGCLYQNEFIVTRKMLRKSKMIVVKQIVLSRRYRLEDIDYVLENLDIDYALENFLSEDYGI